MKNIIKKMIPAILLNWYHQMKSQQRKRKFLKRAYKMQGSESVLKIATAIIETICNTLTTEEKQEIEKIENLRHTLSTNNSKVSIQDFGAGKPNSKRTEEEMSRGIIEIECINEIVKASKSPFWALMLFKLMRKFQPQVSIELGTCLGISAAYQGASLKLNGKGKLITIEGASSIANIADTNIKSLKLDNITVVSGKFQDKLPLILEKNNPVDYLFIDGHHDQTATISYFEMIIPYLSEQAIVVFDDISWSLGMRQAWKHIVSHNKVSVAVDLCDIGICVLDNKQQQKNYIFFPK